ncbi:MAG: hypothetical protein K1X89_05555 [Myxococcaceae bacterium]|nr:hypothetical protein [Myxococcaceae bacterium]
MKMTIRGSLVVLAAVVAGCDGAGGADSTRQGLAISSCPAGMVPWDFYKFPTGLDDQSLRRLQGDAGINGARSEESNYVIVKSATCTPPGKAAIDVTDDVKKYCSAKNWECAGTKDSYAVMFDRAKCNGSRITVTYGCARETADHTADYAQVLCSPRTEQKLACVPANCYGHTRRTSELACAPDLIKVAEPKDTIKVLVDSLERPLQDPSRDSPDAYSGAAGARVITLDQDQMYHLKGAVETQGAVSPQQLLTLWFKSTVAKPGNAGASMDIFRCFLGRIDLKKRKAVKTASGWSVPFDEFLRVPPECNDGARFSSAVQSAWSAAGYDASGAGSVTTALSTELMASYDLEGNAILTSGSVTEENTCAPNPIDFFYNYEAKAHRSYDYYSQTQVPLDHRGRSPGKTPPVLFNTVPANLVAVTGVEVPVLEYKVNKAGRARGSIDATVVMALSGPDSETWGRFLQTKTDRFKGSSFYDEYPKKQFEMTRDVSSQGRKMALASSVVSPVFPIGAFDGSKITALVPVPDPAKLDANGQPVLDYTAMVSVPEEALGIKFDGSLSETGANALMRVRINSKVRSALFDNKKYPLVPGSTVTYVLQVCGQNEVTEDFDISIDASYTLTYNGEYKGLQDNKFKYVKHARVAPADPAKSFNGKFDPTAVNLLPDGAASNLKVAKNNCATSPVFTFKGENIVVPIAEVDDGDGDASDLQPTTSGDPSKLEGTFNSDTTQDCVGARCETTTDQNLGGTDAPIKATVLSIVGDQEEDDTSNKFSTTFKMFGFDVLDTAENGEVKEVETVLTISPNYEAIAKAFGKPFPAFKIEGKRVSASVNGLSVGFEYKIPVTYPPLMGELIFGVGAGAGMNIEVFHKYNPKVESKCATTKADGTQADGCPDPVLKIPDTSFLQARSLCYFLGGRLMEPRTQADADKIRSVIPADTETWIAAQVGNEYQNKSDCATNWNSSACQSGHSQYFRWLSDSANFKRSRNFGAFEDYETTLPQLGGQKVSVDSPLLQKPVDSAVTLQNNTMRMRSMSESHPAACIRPLLSKGTSHEVGIKLNVVAAAGFSVAFCVPSDELGVCLEGSMNLIEAKLTPGVSVTHTKVSNNAGLSASQTKFGAKVTWSVHLLSGALEIKVVTPLLGISYTLFEYEGFNEGEGTLTEFEYDFKDFPVGF